MQPDQLETGDWVKIWMDGQYYQFTAFRGGSLPPVDVDTIFNANYQQSNGNEIVIQSAMYVVQQAIAKYSLPYTVKENRAPPGGPLGNYLQGFIVVANLYDPRYDFQPGQRNRPGPFDFNFQPINTIRPVVVDQTITPAGIFGSATGSIVLAASNGTNGVYTYTWADGPTTASRNGLLSARYTCVVADSSGASTTVTILVKQDAQLTAVVDQQEDDVQLLVSGGLAPYTYLWEDGTTDAGRLNLAPGNYSCTITDVRGATTEVAVTITPYRFYFSQNPILLSVDAGDDYRADPTTKPNLSFVCEVLIEPVYMSGEFVRVGEAIEQPADRNGRTDFEVQVLLDAYLQEHLPALNQTVITRADSLFKRFYLRWWERSGTPVEDGAQTVQQQNYVLLGGLDYYEFAARTWFSTYQAAIKPFLTWQPNNRKVYNDQPEYLYFMADSFALTSFSVRVNVVCSDGSKESFEAYTYQSPRRYEVFCLPVGYVGLGLDQYESATRRVLSWSVQVLNPNGVPISEQRTYLLNYKYAAEKRYFLYTNSLGGLDTLPCTGEAKAVLNPTREEVERGPDPRYDPLLGDRVAVSNSGGLTMTCVTGLLSRAEMAGLQDFLLSTRITLQRNGFYWPGTLKAKALEAYNGSDTARQYEFDFILPQQRLFTPRLPQVSVLNTKPVTAGEGGQP
ncbi:hypothetical protein [Hymenobacter pini]|uniref:hypothetical protein n=1 Tax=Hymenobacter pini TaxID=2880879 RepID=UPI001CF2B2C7|nr:hypothetical protein [Hymenobacter pini]MCA8831976.1 hypothetical protein [Hymenobacter pini]